MQTTIPVAEWAMNQNEQMETSIYIHKSLMNKQFSKASEASTIIHQFLIPHQDKVPDASTTHRLVLKQYSTKIHRFLYLS